MGLHAAGTHPRPLIRVVVGLKALDRPIGSPSAEVQVDALVDTGASTSVIDETVAEHLGLKAVGVRPLVGVGTAAGTLRANEYRISLGFADDTPEPVTDNLSV